MFYKIYSFVSECPFCEALRRFFQEAGISYMYLAVDREGHAALIPELEKWLGREVDESIRTVIGFFDDPNKPPFSFLADEEALSKMLENKEFDVDRFREILLEEQQKHVRDQLMELGASEEDLDYYEKQYAKELVDEVLPVD